jgi:RHS repeat-associated protein
MQNSSSFFQGQARFSNDFYPIYHSPFGVELKGRNLKKNNAKNYRFGFQGMEADDQVKGDGNSYDFGARMLDPRLGRWLSVDKYFSKYPNQSSFGFVLNCPIFYVDPDGKEVKPVLNSIVRDDKTGAHTSTTFVSGAGAYENAGHTIRFGLCEIEAEVIVNENSNTISIKANYTIYISYQFNESHPKYSDFVKAGKKASRSAYGFFGAIRKNFFKEAKERVEQHEALHAEIWAEHHNKNKRF